MFHLLTRKLITKARLFYLIGLDIKCPSSDLQLMSLRGIPLTMESYLKVYKFRIPKLTDSEECRLRILIRILKLSVECDLIPDRADRTFSCTINGRSVFVKRSELVKYLNSIKNSLDYKITGYKYSTDTSKMFRVYKKPLITPLVEDNFEFLCDGHTTNRMSYVEFMNDNLYVNKKTHNRIVTVQILAV